MPEELDKREAIELYPNAVQLSSGPFEVVIELQRLTAKFSDIPGRQPEVSKEILGRLRLSPQHAKSFASLLVQQVLELERQFGELGLPPDQLETWERVVKGAKGQIKP